MPPAAYRRVVLKLSGEALAGAGGRGYDFARVRELASALAEAGVSGVQTLLVIGGGNLWRGREAQEAGLPPVLADRMGMLATVMNGIALGAMLERAGRPARVLTATTLAGFAETWTPERARACLEAGETVIASGGIGQPFFSTDTTAALRALELEADLLAKATQVDGVYSADPRRDASARRLPRLTHDEALRLKLAVMDATALSLCRDHALPIRVFAASAPDAYRRLLAGEDIGSLVAKEDDDDRRPDR